jgi:hypothetical protein
MTGLPFHNFPAFVDTADNLRARGYEVVSPAELDSPAVFAACMADPSGSNAATGKTWSKLLRRDLKLIASGDIDAIAVIPGWDVSRGARLEVFFGCLLGLDVRYARSMRKVAQRRLIRAFGSVVQVDHELLSVAANR